jgi:hypothetical protein
MRKNRNMQIVTQLNNRDNNSYLNKNIVVLLDDAIKFVSQKSKEKVESMDSGNEDNKESIQFLINNWNYFFLMSLRYCPMDSTIRAVTVVFISMAKCLNSSSKSVGIFIVVLVSSPNVSSVPILQGIHTHGYIYV